MGERERETEEWREREKDIRIGKGERVERILRL